MMEPIKILILEDSTDDAQLMLLQLEREGFAMEWQRVETETEFHAALDTQPDLILSDYSLPKYNGIKALAFLNERGLDIPFILVSGTMGEDIAAHAMKQGAADYLLKDRLARLGEAVKHALEQKQLRDERKKSAEALRASEERFRQIFNNANDAIYIWTFGKDGTIRRGAEVNDVACKRMGYSREEFLELSPADINAGNIGEKLPAMLKPLLSQGTMMVEVLHRTKDGRIIPVEVNSRMVELMGEKRILSLARDITERKQAAGKLQKAHEFLQRVQDALSAHIAILDHQGRVVQVNSAWRTFGIQNGLEHPDGSLGVNYLEICDAAKGRNCEEAPQIAQAIRDVLTGIKNEASVEYPCHAPHEERWFLARITSFDNDGQKWVVVAHENITQRKQVEIQIQSQIHRLEALRTIDTAINSNFDLHVTLDIVLRQVLSQLGADAAAILLIDSHSQTIEYAASQGFHSNILRHTQLQLYEGFAGRAVRERRTIHIPNLLEAGGKLAETLQSANENFVDYYSTPLLVKGQAKGVLEIYQRSPMNPNPEWLYFLETLATQAAIGIDNAQLFQGVQQSNVELMIAYDATIAGWSRAMDLRDKETEGHTQRVTELTLKLAAKMGVNQKELVYIRRGAFLHDIGKLGVPDQILLKPGKLTDEEWAVMRRHPVYAYEMLQPIHYLRPALDIPYCHHEKWDGSGYPRGLSGEQIPLAARIFAVVDVWDALRSDRPYREGWPVEKIRGHVIEQSGKHFEPRVVEAFIRLLDESPVV